MKRVSAIGTFILFTFLTLSPTPARADNDDDDLSKIPCPSTCDERTIGSWEFHSGFSLWLVGEPRPERSWWLRQSEYTKEIDGGYILDIGCQHNRYNLSYVQWDGQRSGPDLQSMPFYVTADDREQFMLHAQRTSDQDAGATFYADISNDFWHSCSERHITLRYPTQIMPRSDFMRSSRPPRFRHCGMHVDKGGA
jgi:hypothetical protein